MRVGQILQVGWICTSLTACNTMFDFSPPPPSATVAVTFADAKVSANYYKSAYYSRAAGVANGFQVFEIPIIGAAVTAVTGAALKASKDVPLVAGIAGGTFAVLENEYNPRERTLIYFGAQDAMSCLERLAARGALLFENKAISQAAIQTIRDRLANESDKQKAAAYQKAINVSGDGPAAIDDAISAVNASVTRQAISKAARPNMADIASTLRQSSTQSATNKTFVASANSGPRIKLVDAQTEIAVQDILDYSAEFDNSVNACKATAG